MITTAPVDKLSEADYMKLKAACAEDGRSVSQVRRDQFADEVFSDIFPAEDLKLEKIRDGIASQQSRLDQLEAAARDRAGAYMNAIARRDALVNNVRLLSERRARISDHLAGQPNYIESIGSDRGRSDIEFTEACDFVQKYRAALVALESLLEQHQGNLVLAEAAVASFQK